MLYKYEGPVYRFEHIVIPKWLMYTHASSQVQDLNNLKFKAKKLLKLNKTARDDLNPNYLNETRTYSNL